MSRGGIRCGAGAKPTWKHGKTRTIRVPIALADEILAFAHRIDEQGIIETDTHSKTLDLSGVSIRHHNGVIAVHLEDLARFGYEIMPESLGKLVKARLQKLEVDKQLNYGNNTQGRERSRVLHS